MQPFQVMMMIMMIIVMISIDFSLRTAFASPSKHSPRTIFLAHAVQLHPSHGPSNPSHGNHNHTTIIFPPNITTCSTPHQSNTSLPPAPALLNRQRYTAPRRVCRRQRPHLRRVRAIPSITTVTCIVSAIRWPHLPKPQTLNPKP